MKPSQALAVVVALAVVTVVVVSGPLYSGGPPIPSSPSATWSDSTEGLRLDLSTNATGLAPGEGLLIRVAETNTLRVPDNVTRGSAWAATGLGLGSCPDSVFPFGVAVFHGRITKENVSEAKPLRIFPPTPCPMLLRLVTGYLFEANGSNAVVLPGNGQALPMTADVTVKGVFPNSAAAGPLASGDYTVVAGDEWGALAFLYFEVA